MTPELETVKADLPGTAAVSVPTTASGLPVTGARGLLAAAWQANPVAMYVADENRIVLAANDAALAALAPYGLTVGSQLPGTQLLVDGARITEADRPLTRALAGEAVVDEEFVHEATEYDRARRVVVSAHPFTAADGARYALVGWRDVTDRWEAEEARQAAFARLTLLLDGAADYAILQLDPMGRILTWSASAERLKRFTAEQVLGRPYSLFFTAEDRAAGVPDEALEQARRSGRHVTEGERLRGDGTRFWARGVLTAQYDDAGEVTGFVKVSHDVTDERRAKQRIEQLNEDLRTLNVELERRIAERTDLLQRQASQLAEANHELEAFSYSVSHDLRAPLRSMSGFARLLVEDYGDALDEQGRHYLERIEAAGRRMGELIEGLLSFARLQRQRVEHQDLDMTALVTGAWDLVGGGGPAELVLEDLPPAKGDAALLQQVWTNLLENAVKFTQRAEQPRVRVWAERSGGLTWYVVSDNGAGFDPDVAAKMFQPFHRLHRAEDFPGTGIGLAVVERIVARHGGRITATGRVDHGASFRFTLGAPVDASIVPPTGVPPTGPAGVPS